MNATMNRNGVVKNLRNGHDRAALRCAIYTRKSTEEGLEQEFNSLDAQRESSEAYIKSQNLEGWQCLPERYDDGGFSGGNMDRPALRRLLADIEAGRINVVVVYKVDRLSRSLLDFAKMMEVFDQHNVAFVSVTQLINSATSMGRLMLNVLLSFAQFEREIIGERTRDKIAATRRKGKWAGGHPILGYDIDPHVLRLVVNEIEAAQVRAIFQLYLDHEAMLPVVRELLRRDWTNKRWTTRKGRDRGGKVFTRTSLHKLLTNVAYAGKIRYKSEVHPGEHTAIVDESVWQRVQTILRRNYVSGSASVRNKSGALLKGLIACSACGCAMTPSHSNRGNRAYRYYVCSKAQKLGRDSCPAKNIPAGEIERFVVERIKCIGRDHALVEDVVAAAQAQLNAETTHARAEVRRLEQDIDQWSANIGIVAQRVASDPAAFRQLADLQERIRHAEQRLPEVRATVQAGESSALDQRDVAATLADFDELWSVLAPREQARVLQILIECVAYDGATGQVAITFHPPGIKSLTDELAKQQRKHP